MPIILHGSSTSPAVRASLLTLHALGVEFTENPVNILTGEHLLPQYLRINPLHTIPTLQDGETSIFDSHAINIYLADRYAKEDDGLYPSDVTRRAIVNQRLFFDCSTLFTPFRNVVLQILKLGAKVVAKEHALAINEAYDSLETLMEGLTYVAGQHLTLADFSIIATVTSMNVFVPIASNRYPNITKWIARMRELPYYQKANQEGLDVFTTFMRSKLS